VKRVLSYEADRARALTLEELSKIISDAEGMGMYLSAKPVVVVRTTPTNYAEVGTVRKITVSDTRW
jgi:hypothetical protein